MRTAFATFVSLLLISAAVEAAERHQTSAGPVMVEPVVEDLDTPWAVAFLPDGAFLITERDGRLLRIGRDGRRNAVAGVPEVWAYGQGGLLDVVVPRDFANSREIFLTYAEPAGDGARTAMAAARLSDDGARLEDLRVLFHQLDAPSGGQHFGSRVVEAPDGTLFITTGERAEFDPAQDLGSLKGKIVRINRDGSVPQDNPFVGKEGRPEIYSYGHRNVQGAALDLEGRLWTVEHGARGGDEINRPEPGLNYGWPVISYGTHYSGAEIGVGTSKPGMEQPKFYWDPSIAPAGMTIYSGRLWPDWRGDIFVGSLKYSFLSRLERDGDEVGDEERLFEDDYDRIRDVREGPDGSIWFLAEDDGTLYRMRPAE